MCLKARESEPIPVMECLMKTITQASISLAAAERMLAAAREKAIELNFSVAVSVVDASGVVKAFARMDGAPLVASDAAYRKARTAVGFGLPTGEAWFGFIQDDPILREGAHALEDFILLGGGLPIRDGEQLVGAIGVAGGHYSHDEACAKAALQEFDQLT